MSKSTNSGKPLSGIPNISNALKSGLTSDLIRNISSGGITLENVNIQSGNINGVIIGSIQPGSITSTTFTSGTPGNGYTACFFGNIVGDSACWLPVNGQWNIQGDLLVRDISDLGSLRLSQNTISSTNTNGNINISPNGSGITTINSGLTLNTLSGNILHQTQNGLYYLSTTKTNTLVSGGNTLVSTDNGDISLSTGNSRVIFNISFITIGTTFTTITTTIANGFTIGQKIIFTNTNSTPNINGTYTINSIVSTVSFTILLTVPITVSGTTGNVQLTNNIYLSASNNIFVPTNVPIIFGNNTSNPSLISDGTNTTLTSSNIIVNGNFTVNGTTTTSNSTIVTIQDPVINVGGTSVYSSSDFMDRGVSFRYYNGSNTVGFFGRNNSTGCFTYIPNATESGNVYSGTPGCATFGGITGTSLNLQGGAISNVSSIDTCNINCSGTLAITGTTAINFTSPLSTFSGIITVMGNASIGNILTTSNIYSAANLVVTSITSTTISSPLTTVTGDLNANNGTSYLKNVVISGTTTGITLDEIVSIEHLSGTVINPSNIINTTFVKVNTAVTATGTMTGGTVDGFEKKILCSGLVSGSIYRLYFPTGLLLDPDTGTTIAKYLDFDSPGMSCHLIWDATISAYIVLAASVCAHT